MSQTFLKIALILTLSITGCSNNQVYDSHYGGLNSINAASVKNDIRFLASDSFKGKKHTQPRTKFRGGIHI